MVFSNKINYVYSTRHYWYSLIIISIIKDMSIVDYSKNLILLILKIIWPKSDKLILLAEIMSKYGILMFMSQNIIVIFYKY